MTPLRQLPATFLELEASECFEQQLFGLADQQRPNMDPGQRVKETKQIEYPQDHCNHDNSIQDRLNGGLHRDESIYQP